MVENFDLLRVVQRIAAALENNTLEPDFVRFDDDRHAPVLDSLNCGMVRFSVGNGKVVEKGRVEHER
ncbi:hypothetical protein BpHYR1_018543 [Brachionus plicatilis]|uniref:Uncharacterized protein n=1 Tax=Brachionus plicatilis TaxID=10195 RepID=A0A3M7PFK1_BRAPC|nr:hypothetical protein BpHYR1_018543 [Brachionus plicatilis]